MSNDTHAHATVSLADFIEWKRRIHEAEMVESAMYRFQDLLAARKDALAQFERYIGAQYGMAKNDYVTDDLVIVRPVVQSQSRD